MTIYIENEQETLDELTTTLFELEVYELSEATRRAVKVDISDLIKNDWEM